MSNVIRVALTLTQDWHRVPGGTATAANAVAGELARITGVDGTEVEMTGVVPAGSPSRAGFTPPVQTKGLPLGLPWLYDSWHHLRWPRITSSVPDADVVHLTVPIAPPREKVPMVATVHDVLPFTMSSSFTRRGASMMRRGLRRISAEADSVMVPTESGRSEFVAQGFDPARLKVVPLGVDIPGMLDEGSIDQVLTRYGIERPYVLFVGTAEPRKGLDVLAAAMARLDRDEVTLVLVGPDGWGDVDLSRVKRLVRPGFVSDTDLQAIRAGAASCAMPSRAEGFGLPVLEAMAAGIPVVTTSGTPMEEFAHGVARFVPAGDVEALAVAIADILDDSVAAREMGARGRERASGFTWERTAQRILEVYETVLG